MQLHWTCEKETFLLTSISGQGVRGSFVSFALKYSHSHCFLNFVDKFLLLKLGASVRVVNQLLTEMDGLENRQQVFIMAATNRPGKDPKIMNKRNRTSLVLL